MFTRPRPNLFEMLINLTSPQWLDRPDLLTCYIDTCGKKIQSEIIIQIKRCSAPHSKIGNFSCERWRRLLTKEKQDALVQTAHPFKLPFLASQRKLTVNEAVWDVKTR